MTQVTNQLVAKSKKLAFPAALAAAFGLGAVLFVGHGNVQAAMTMDDDSVSALTSLDRAMEAVTARVTPAVVYVAVTSKSAGEPGSDGQMQGIPPHVVFAVAHDNLIRYAAVPVANGWLIVQI